MGRDAQWWKSRPDVALLLFVSIPSGAADLVDALARVSVATHWGQDGYMHGQRCVKSACTCWFSLSRIKIVHTVCFFLSFAYRCPNHTHPQPPHPTWCSAATCRDNKETASHSYDEDDPHLLQTLPATQHNAQRSGILFKNEQLRFATCPHGVSSHAGKRTTPCQAASGVQTHHSTNRWSFHPLDGVVGHGPMTPFRSARRFQTECHHHHHHHHQDRATPLMAMTNCYS